MDPVFQAMYTKNIESIRVTLCLAKQRSGDILVTVVAIPYPSNACTMHWNLVKKLNSCVTISLSEDASADSKMTVSGMLLYNVVAQRDTALFIGFEFLPVCESTTHTLADILMNCYCTL